MPTYEYACTECGDQTEAVQKFTDDPLTVCVLCGGRLRKVFSPVGIVFKGAGFYRTDSRAAVKEPVSVQKANGSETKSTADSASGESAAAGAKGGGRGSDSSSGSGSGSGTSASAGNGSSSGGGSSGGSSARGKPSSTKVA